MRERPDVSATVCNYNGRAYLADCLKALVAQTFPPRRIVVYDNASDDGSADLVRAEFPGVEVVEMGNNLGPCVPRNRGLEEATTEWVLQVDSDAILAPDCLERLVEQIGSLGDVVCVMPRALVDGDDQTIHYDGGFFHYAGVMTLRHFFQAVPTVPEACVEIDAAISMALLVRKSAVLETGGYDPDYFILFEDHDLSYRLRMRDRKILLVPRAIVRHRQGTAGISFRKGKSYPERRAYLHSRNRWMLLLRNHSMRSLILSLPGILAYEMLWLGYVVQQGLWRPWVKGKRDLFGMLPTLWSERRVIQGRRLLPDRRLLRCQSLTHAPMVRAGFLRRAGECSINVFLKCWWALIRWML